MQASQNIVQRIQELLPGLAIHSLEKNEDGLMNEVWIVNGERVFRFAKDEAWIRDCLQKETALLSVLRDRLNLPVPVFDRLGEDFVSYPLLPGQGLSRADFYRQPETMQEALAEALAVFLIGLRGLPVEMLLENGIGPNNCVDTPEEYCRLYEELEREVLVYADSHVRRIVRQHFEPLLEGQLDLSYTPALVHGDLGQRHILFDPRQGRLSGVIDWGIAGLSDPAHDLG